MNAEHKFMSAMTTEESASPMVPGKDVAKTPAIKTFLFARTEAAKQEAAASLEALPGLEIEKLESPEALQAALSRDHVEPTALLIKIDPDATQDIDLVRVLRDVPGRGRLSIVALMNRAPHVNPLRAIRAGADDVLLMPVDLDEAKEVFLRARERARLSRIGPTDLGKIVVFMHLTGGAGATTLAVNTATLLSKAEKGKNCCLLDLDVQLGNAATILDLPTASPIQEFIDAPSRLDAQMLGGMMMHHATGLHVLSSPHTILPLNAYGVESITNVLELTRRQYNFVVVDMPSSLMSWTDAVLKSAFVIYLVTPLTVSSAHRIHKFLALLRQERITGLPLKIVVNRHNKGLGKANDISISQFEKATGVRVDFLVPNDYRLVSMSHEQGKPAVTLKPKSPFAESLKRMLARDLADYRFEQPRRWFLSRRA